MSSLSFPDVNVWLAVLLADHIHRDAAKRWWITDDSDTVAFTRFTQLAVLRLLTTASAMNGRPLTISKAWAAYDRLFSDDRVALIMEPPGVEVQFRRLAGGQMASPKVWADAYLSAFVNCAGGRLVTFDRALAVRSPGSLLLT